MEPRTHAPGRWHHLPTLRQEGAQFDRWYSDVYLREREDEIAALLAAQAVE